MNSYAYAPGAGHRRLDERTAATDQLAQQFEGLPEDVSHRQVLTVFKRAAPYIGIPPRLVHAVDTLMSWSRSIDWADGQRPIVFPSNEKLTQKLGIGVRQVQKMLGAAARLGLITHRDSANGNRVGARGKDGRLIYAYGIDLSPLGLRYEEFMAAATKGAEADLRIKVLRQRLAAARRRIRTLAQLVDDERIDSIDARTAVEISLLATSQMRRVRDEELLSACVDQMEARADDLAKAVAVATQGFPDPLIPQKDSPSGDSDDAPITTTKQPKTAKAAYSNGYPEKSSRTEYDVRYQQPQTEVEADLAKHGVDPEFIAAVIPEFMLTTTSRPTWGDLINTAERLVDQAAIHRNVWHEACRLMGLLSRGAADRRMARLGRSQCPSLSRNLLLWAARGFPISPSSHSRFGKVHSGTDLGKRVPPDASGYDRRGFFPNARSQSRQLSRFDSQFESTGLLWQHTPSTCVSTCRT